ncbi:MAG: hypothetical protein IJ067_00150 [Prevotella sp.]|nr:hypothetical protein [Prevotella sp.]
MGFYIRFEFHIFIHREDGRRQESKPQSGDEFISPEEFCRQAEEEIAKQRELLTRSTVENYQTALRSLRSLLTKIYGDESRQMFGNVYTGQAVTDKRSLPIDDVARLKAVRLPKQSFLSLVRDLFLFSFYALGMPFVDMAYLRRQQASDILRFPPYLGQYGL